MNYIGCKYSLLKEIETILRKNGIPMDGIAVDLFSGTGSVAQMLKKLGFVTYANDWQYYSFVTVNSFISLNELPKFSVLLKDAFYRKKIEGAAQEDVPMFSIHERKKKLASSPARDILNFLNQVSGRKGRFFNHFCEGGKARRYYFSKENGLRIQAIRDQIENWKNASLITDNEKNWLIACLIESADRVANTASIYGAYLKHIKKSAQKPLRLVSISPIPSKHDETLHKAYCLDGEVLLQQLRSKQTTLTYIDPPYNHRQYSGNYHILETIARWDLGKFKPRGVTGLRPQKKLRSPFCLRATAYDAFRRLLSKVKSDYVLFSYNNEGLLSENDLADLFSELFLDVQFKKIAYQRFRADNDSENRKYKGNTTEEFLILAFQQKF